MSALWLLRWHPETCSTVIIVIILTMVVCYFSVFLKTTPFSRQKCISPQIELLQVILSQLQKVKPKHLSMEGRPSSNEHSHGNISLSIASLSNTFSACIHFISVSKCAWYYNSLVNGDRILDINTEVTEHRKEPPGTLWLEEGTS